MYDKYDLPSERAPSRDYEDEQPSEAMDIIEQVRPHVPKIAAAAIALILLFFVYDYFIGSVKQVSIVVLDAEGDEIEGAIVKIMSESGQEIERAVSSEGFSVRKGTYK